MVFVHLKCSQYAALSYYIFHLNILHVVFKNLVETRSLYDFLPVKKKKKKSKFFCFLFENCKLLLVYKYI
jgi:hypothetical protein